MIVLEFSEKHNRLPEIVRHRRGMSCLCALSALGQSATRNVLVCAACNKHISITAGTAFHKTRKSLTKWFMAMYLMMTSKRGMSAKELQRQLGLGSYQTAWCWLHKLRRTTIDPDRKPLSGLIEVDETYVGGVTKGSVRKGRSTIQKSVVVCAVEKTEPKGCGRVRLAVISNASGSKLQAFLKDQLEPKSSVHTDGWRGYSRTERSGFKHIREVADKDGAHINFPLTYRVFSLLKRWLLGSHQGAVSRKHLQVYLDEYTFRFNRRTAHSLTHSVQRLMEGVVREQCKPYWQIVGRSANNVTMRQNADLSDLEFLEEIKKRGVR